MIAHQIFAEILDEEIKNIMVCKDYELANWLTRMMHGDTAFAVDCTYYPCNPGDKYKNSIFYHVDNDGNETVIEQVSSAETEVATLNAQIEYISMMSGIEMEANNE